MNIWIKKIASIQRALTSLTDCIPAEVREYYEMQQILR